MLAQQGEKSLLSLKTERKINPKPVVCKNNENGSSSKVRKTALYFSLL